MQVGTIVRVPLHGRRVRGWVVDAGVTSDVPASELRPVTAVVSAGPPAEVVELCRWAAWRYAGPFALLLRAASPPNVVPATSQPELSAEVAPEFALPAGLEHVRQETSAVVAWPPAVDRRELVMGLVAEEGSTIVVVPDAAGQSAFQTELDHFGRTSVALRAEMPDRDRALAWDAARAGACVVIGARLAVLAPVPDLAAIVVLDEGDEALKEERAPAWHARELARERTRRTGARLTMVSPTPTVDAEIAASAVARPSRATERRGWPRLAVIDRREAAPGRSLLSDELAGHAHTALERGAHVVCVLNRKGRARHLTCRNCGHVAQCEVCGAAVVEGEDDLVCPRCGAVRPPVCLNCHGTRFVRRRPGVSRMRDELAALLPRATVAEVTGGSAPDLAAAQVLVGTESVLHQARAQRVRVELVAFLEFDQELLAARFRAAEQALWLLVRAARLVGPRDGPGVVLVQTRVPEHEVIVAARSADPIMVAGSERARREALRFPPFGGLAEVSGEPAAVEAACAALRTAPPLTVSGPSTSARSAFALVQAPSADALADAFASIDLTAARAQGRLRVEVEPSRI